MGFSRFGSFFAPWRFCNWPRVSPHRALPPEVLERRKSGFTLPVKKWMAMDRRRFGMRDWALELLRDEFLPRANEAGLSRTIERSMAEAAVAT